MKGLGGHGVLRGRYDFEAELGRGAGGVVYSARDRTDGRSVAIKLVHSAVAEHENGSLSAGLAHEHLVAVHERVTDENVTYLVMERIDGSDLTPFCTVQARLPVGAVISVMARIADALAYLHDRGFVHGDVKPANVLYGAGASIVKLADLTPGATHMSRGTPAYLAPEQICGAPPSAAGDQFAFGVTLYQLVTGTRPFEAASLPQLCYSIVHDKHADPRLHDASSPAALVSIIDRTLEKQASARFENMRALSKALQVFVS